MPLKHTLNGMEAEDGSRIDHWKVILPSDNRTRQVFTEPSTKGIRVHANESPNQVSQETLRQAQCTACQVLTSLFLEPRLIQLIIQFSSLRDGDLPSKQSPTQRRGLLRSARNDGWLLLLKPRPIQLIIHLLIRQQFSVRSLLDDPSIVNDHDPIRARDG